MKTNFSKGGPVGDWFCGRH